MVFPVFMPMSESSLYQAKNCWNSKQWAVPASKSFHCKYALDNQYLCKPCYAHTENVSLKRSHAKRQFNCKSNVSKDRSSHDYIWKYHMPGILVNSSGCYPKGMKHFKVYEALHQVEITMDIFYFLKHICKTKPKQTPVSDLTAIVPLSYNSPRTWTTGTCTASYWFSSGRCLSSILF